MIYALSIDWLSLFGLYYGDGEWQPVEDGFFSYKRETYGTRSFSRFYRVRTPNDEGGTDEFAEVQATPYSSILPPYVIIVRFVNRALYLDNFWELADRFFRLNLFGAEGISRVDICADFNDFATMEPKQLIEGFAAKKYRHIGRGVGALYFNHGIGVERDAFDRRTKDYGVQYTGLSFGTHSSGARVYLYNKTEELLTQGDKPWIRDIWRQAGLDVRHVWRLEVSIKREGLKFRDKNTGQEVKIGTQEVSDSSELDKVYHTFVRKLFSFIKNKPHIPNVTREPRLVLFDNKPAYDRGAIRNLSPGDRMEKILIKYLYQFADLYRGSKIFQAESTSKHLAECLAYATDLHDWMEQKKTVWDTPIHK